MGDTPDNVAVGVAGWSYPDWNGYVYPAGVGNRLRFVSRFVDMVEVNSSFYRPPTATTVAGWINQTAESPSFYFTAKLHRDLTHGGEFTPGMVTAIRDGFAPMAEAGKLRHLLAQFRWDFDDTATNRRRVERLCAAFGAMTTVTCEMRHNTWQSAGALAFLAEQGAGLANLDYPMARNSFNLDLCTVHRHAYLRLHGRNAAAWFNRSAGRDETYNYLYDTKEIDAIVSRAVTLARQSSSLTIVTNNHYQGKEMVNAIQLKSQLSASRVVAPEILIRHYPQLSECADPA